MNNITAINVSNYFTNKAIEEKNPLTLMQALKLTYIAQGFHLSLEGEPFFKEKIEAWKHGPVVKELYDHLCEIRDEDGISIKKEQDIKNVSFNEKQIDILDVVFGEYAKLGGWDLSVLTHKRGAPWQITYYDKGKNCVIDLNLIEDHFKKIVGPRSFAILLAEIKYS